MKRIRTELQAILDASARPKIVITKQGIEYYNESFSKMTGYNINELITTDDLLKIFNPQYREAINSCIEELDSINNMPLQIRIIKKNGDEIWVSLTFILFDHEDVKYYALEMCNISEFSHAVDTFPDIVFDVQLFNDKSDKDERIKIEHCVQNPEASMNNLKKVINGHIVYLNDEAKKYLQLDSRDEPTLNIFKILKTGTKGRIIEFMLRLFPMMKSKRKEFKVVDRHGAEHILEVNAYFIGTTYPYVIRCVGRDLDESRETDNEYTTSTELEPRMDPKTMYNITSCFQDISYFNSALRNSDILPMEKSRLHSRIENRIKQVSWIFKDLADEYENDDERYAGNFENILFADFNVPKVFLERIKFYNYNPIQCTSNESLEKLYDDYKCNAIVLDSDDISFHDILNLIKNKECKIIALTSNPLTSKGPLIAAGVKAFIRQPYTETDLIKTIYHVINNS